MSASKKSIRRAACGLGSALLIASCQDFLPEVGAPAPLGEGGAGDAGTGDGGAHDAFFLGDAPGAHQVSFALEIRPIMNRLKDDPAGPGCASCHYTTAGDQQGIDQGGLNLTTLGELRRGGITSANIIAIPGNPEGSALVQKLRGTYKVGLRMPRSGPPYLRDDETQLVADWIAQGARGADNE